MFGLNMPPECSKKIEKPTIIYDGSCQFCLDQVGKIRIWDKRNHFDFIASQSDELALRFPFLKEMNLEQGMRLVACDGTVYVGADSVYQIAKNLPGPNLIAWLYVLPGCKQIAKLIYSWIAKNRKKLPTSCESGTCKIE